MRLHPQGRIEGGHLRDGAPLGTPSDASSPSERSEQAGELTLGKAFAAPRGPTGRARGPGYRSLGTFGQPIFGDVSGQDTSERPYGQDQLRERLGLFDRHEQLLHGGIILTYAVTEA